MRQGIIRAIIVRNFPQKRSNKRVKCKGDNDNGKYVGEAG
jgi:hypothetical protein